MAYFVLAKVGKGRLSSYVKKKESLFSTTVRFVIFTKKTNRFPVPMRLFSNTSQKTSTCGKNISDTYLFLQHFDVFCDKLLYRRTATWNLFVKLNPQMA